MQNLKIFKVYWERDPFNFTKQFFFSFRVCKCVQAIGWVRAWLSYFGSFPLFTPFQFSSDRV